MEAKTEQEFEMRESGHELSALLLWQGWTKMLMQTLNLTHWMMEGLEV